MGGRAREEEEVQLGRQKEHSKRWYLFKTRLHLGALFENLDIHLFGSTRAVVQVFCPLALLLFQGKVKLHEKQSKQLPRPRYWLSQRSNQNAANPASFLRERQGRTQGPAASAVRPSPLGTFLLMPGHGRSEGQPPEGNLS